MAGDPTTEPIARPRLVQAVADARATLVEAGSGFGKTVLANQLASEYQLGFLACEARHRDVAVVVDGLVAAARRAGVAVAPTLQLDGAVDAVVAGLRATPMPVLLVVDDAHRLDPVGAALCAQLATIVPSPHRLLVLARQLPDAFDALGDDGVVRLTERDLAFDAPELERVLALARAPVGDLERTALLGATGGWAAVVVLAAQRIARADDPNAECDRIVAQPAVLSFVLDADLATLDVDTRERLIQAAHLPLLSAEIGAAIGDGTLLERVRGAGIPLMPARDGWRGMPGPIVDYLTALAPLNEETARAAAGVYTARGETVTALDLLIDVGLEVDAAAALERLAPERLAAIPFAQLADLAGRFSEATLAGNPRVLLHVARAAQLAGRMHGRTAALARLDRLTASSDDAALRRAVEAEVVRDLERDGDIEAAAAQALVLIEACAAGEIGTRARLLETLGRTRAWAMEPDALADAARLLGESANLCRRAGEPAWLSEVLAALGYMVHYSAGAHDLAIERLREAAAVAGAPAPLRGIARAFLGEVLVNAGRFDEADVVLDDASTRARQMGDTRLVAYVEWEKARLASQRGDATGTRDHVSAVERHRGDWFDKHTGAYFLADASDLLDRVDERDLTATYLARAQERRAEAPESVLVAEAAIAARSGDPAAALRVLDDPDTASQVEPRERWRVMLLRAFAAQRLGRADAIELAAAAFTAAAALGTPSLPVTREPAVAAALGTARSGTVVRVLDGFGVSAGGRVVSLPAGQPSQLVKVIAAEGGRVHAEVTIEALWPGRDPASGKKLLRNVLTRLRDADVALVERDNDHLVFCPDTVIDAQLFEGDAERALRDGKAAQARTALARYRGDLLPDERYEEWAALPRERLRRRVLALCALVIEDARARGDLAAAQVAIDRAIDVDPDEEAWYLQAATLFLDAGRPAIARHYLRRAADALEGLGLPPSVEHARLRARAHPGS